MELHNQERIISSGNSGKHFDVESNGILFQTLTSTLYKDKPRAVVREEIANCVDAHRMRDELFRDCYNFETKEITDHRKFQELVDAGYSVPGTPWEIHLPTEIEPWLIFKDCGIGLTPDSVIGKIQYDEAGTAIIIDGKPLRQGGVYTTLFGSDKRQNNLTIGSYGLGCKSPYSISDTFTVNCIVGGKKHSYLMYMDESRTPSVEWLTEGETLEEMMGDGRPELVNEPNGVEVRIEGIEYRIFDKLKLAASEILQTFPQEEQPIINSGMFSFRPMEVEPFTEHTMLVKNAHYGSLFYNQIVVNTGGVIYPVDQEKYSEFEISEVVLNYLKGRGTLMINMPLGSVGIPPSREEISYDKKTVDNISTVIKEVSTLVDNKIKEIISQISLKNNSIGRYWPVYQELSKIFGHSEASNIIEQEYRKRETELKQAGLFFDKSDSGNSFGISLELGKLRYGQDFRVYHRGFNKRYTSEKESSHVSTGYMRNPRLVLNKYTFENSMIVLLDNNFAKSTIISRLNGVWETSVKYIYIFGVDKEIVQPNSVSDMVKKLSDIYECEVLLSSQICDKYEDYKSQNKLTRASTEEVVRNVRIIDPFDSTSAACKESPHSGNMPDIFFENGLEEFKNPITFISYEEWEKYENSSGWYSRNSKVKLQLAFLELDMDRLYIVKGTRTVSAKMFRDSEDTREITSEIINNAIETRNSMLLKELWPSSDLSRFCLKEYCRTNQHSDGFDYINKYSDILRRVGGQSVLELAVISWATYQEEEYKSAGQLYYELKCLTPEQYNRVVSFFDLFDIDVPALYAKFEEISILFSDDNIDESYAMIKYASDSHFRSLSGIQVLQKCGFEVTSKLCQLAEDFLKMMTIMYHPTFKEIKEKLETIDEKLISCVSIDHDAIYNRISKYVSKVLKELDNPLIAKQCQQEIENSIRTKQRFCSMLRFDLEPKLRTTSESLLKTLSI